jgi:hypothetical protein
MPRAVRELALALGLFVAALVVSHFTRERGFEERLNSDEPEWIAISILHWRQLVHGDPPAGAELDAPDERSTNPWKLGVQHTTFGYMNPCLPKLAWGAALDARGFREASPLAFQVFHRDDLRAGQRAREEIVPAAPTVRAVVVALSAASAVLLFFVARALWPGRIGWIGGAAAFALWFASPLVQSTSSYIRTDYFMLPLCLGALLAALHASDALSGARGERAQWRAAGAIGLLCGLAVASKLNGALACFALGLWVVLLWLRAPAETRPSFARGPLVALALAALVSAAVFFALNPVLWREPLGGVGDILARWDKLMRYFTETWGPSQGFEVPRSTLARAGLFARKTLARDDALGAGVHPVLAAVLLAAGIVALASRWREARPAIALAFVAVFVAGTALWLPLDWERFYLTATPCVVLLEAAAIAGSFDFVLRRRASASA